MLSTLFTLSYTCWMSERALVASMLGGSDEDVRAIALRWAQTLCSRCGVEVQAEGLERIDWTQPLVIVSNHQSHFDIPVIMAGLGRAFGFLTKTELFRFPAFATAMRRIGCVAIDRDNKASARASLELAASRVRAGAQLVVFAEGTRSDDGRLQPFKKGPFYLIQEAQVQAVPIALLGTCRVLPKHALSVRPGRVELRIGDPIPCLGTAPDARDRLREQVHEAVASLLEK